MRIAEDLRRSVLQAAIDGKLTGGNREGWRFVELNEIFQFVDYRGMTPIKSTEGIFLITASNIRKGYMDYTRKEYISPDEYSRRLGRGVTEKGDLLFTTEAPMGHVSICDLEQCSCGQRIITLKARAEVINKLYMYFMLSEYFQKQLLDNCTGTTAKGIKADKLKHFLVPLPSIDEQRRIVSRLDEILPKIAELEAAENELEDLKRRFPGDMRDALLKAALEGRLTGSNTEGWRWVKLGDVVAKKIKRGKSPKYAQRSSILVFAQKCNTKRGNIDLSLALYLDESIITKYPKEEFMLDGDIVLNSTGRGTLGRVGRYRITDNPQNMPLVPDSHVTIIRPMKNISSDFVYYILKYYQPYIETLGEGSTNQTELSAKKVAEITIHLPPIEEQRRIVKRLNELLPLCEALE